MPTPFRTKLPQRTKRATASKRPRIITDPLVIKHTDSILGLLEQGGRADVHARAVVGGLLRDVRDHLHYGLWMQWVVEKLPFTHRTAARAITLHAYQQKEPALFEKVAPLGMAKAYLLMTLHKSTTQPILKGKHVIPSSGVAKTVRQMSFPELLELVSKLVGPPKSNPAEALVGSYRRQVRQLIRTLDALVDARAHIDDDDVEELHDDLLAAAQQFAAAFEIDD